MGSGAFPALSGAIYLVLTSPEVTDTNGFCTSYCGWHSYLTASNGAVLKFAFIGSPARCPSAVGYSACGVLANGGSPNGNTNADEMISSALRRLLSSGPRRELLVGLASLTPG